MLRPLLIALTVALTWPLLPSLAHAAEPVVTAPEPLTQPLIAYPSDVSDRSVGLVGVRFTVTTAGAVTGVTVLSSNHPAFAPAVVAALLATRFTPAAQDGVPFEAEIEVEIEVPPPAEPDPASFAASISGTVYERGSRRLLAGAQIAVAGQNRTTASDARGRFSLEVAPGALTVYITAPGYERLQVEELVAGGEQIEVIYRLQPQAASPLELVVEAERERAEVSRVRLSTRELKSVPGTFDDAIRVVQKLPNVTQSNEFAGDLIVRGADSRDTKIYIDGVEVPFVFHFGSLKSIVATEMIQEVVLYPSNFSVRFGDAIGGILDVRIKDPESERWTGRTLISTLLSEAFGEGPLGDKTSLQIGARSSYAHLFVDKLIPESAGVNFSTLPKFRDYQARLVHRAGDWTLRAFIFGAQDELALVGQSDRQIDPDSPFSSFSNVVNQHSQTLNASYARGMVTGTTLVGHTRTSFEIDLANQEKFNIDDDTLTVRSDWELSLSRLFRVANGIDWIFSRQIIDIYFPRPPRPGEFDYDFFTAERLTYKFDDNVSRGGVYSEARIGPKDGVNGALGLRYQIESESKVATLDPRSLLLLPIKDLGTFKAGYGVYHQYVQDMETAPPPVGNPLAGPNRAHHAMLGWQKSIAWNLDAQLEVFYKWMDRLITENPEPLSEPRFDNWGKGRAYGGEISLRKPLTEKFSGWVNYSFTRSFRKIQPGFAEEPFLFDQPHIFNLIASYMPSAKWELGGALRLASGNPREELLQTLYFGDRAEYIPLFGELTEREKPYLRLDTRVKRTWLYDKWNLAFLFEIINMTNYKNLLFSQFNTKTQERETVNGLPFFPYIGLEAKF